MPKNQTKGNVFYRLFFKRGDADAYGRFAFFFDTLMQSFSGIFASGAFYTAFLRLNDISMSDVGVMTYMPIIANLSCIFSPFIFRNMKRRKGVLMAARMSYYMLNLIGVALVPFLVTNAGARVFLMSLLLSLGNVIWGLFVGGFADWELQFLPQDGTREEFYAYRSLIASVVSSVTSILAGFVATAIEATAPEVQLAWLFWLRVGGFAFILLDVIIFLRAKERPYSKSEFSLKVRDLVALPMRHKPFRSAILLRCAFQFSMALTTSSWTYYLMDCGLGYSTLSFLSSLSPLMALLLTPFALRIFRKMGCVNNLFLYRGVECFIYIGYAFILPVNVRWLYPVLFVLMQIVTVGTGIADINYVYLFMPEKDRLAYYSFYYAVSTVASFLGSLAGASFITKTASKSLSLFGAPIESVQLLMLLQAVLHILGILAFARLRRWLVREEKAVKAF